VALQSTIKWHRVADSIEAIDWQPNQMAVAEAGGRKITLIQQGSNVYACAYSCPHASGALADGWLDAAGHLVCPLHRYKFNLTNGRNTTGEGYYLKTYAVEVREAGVFVGFEEGRRMLHGF